jgi:hypothetical protein
MKLENLLKVDKVLRIALPCLAIGLFFSSCSNDELSETSNQTADVSGLTFTATAPTASNEYSTRLGIDDNSVTEDRNNPEQFIWLDGDKVTFYFKAVSGGVDQKIEYKAVNISEDGKACDMAPVEGATLANGFYKVYALTPGSSDNFLNGIDGTKIDLSNQSYPNGAENHSYLRDYMYNYATTVVQIHGNSVVSGSIEMPFRNITSLLRFRVTNSTGADVTVKNISISYSGDQLFDQGVFTPADPVGNHTITAAGTSQKNSMSLATDKSLSKDGYFDSYMVVFPTAGFTSPSSNDKVTVIVDYLDKNGNDQSKRWEIPMNTSNFKHATDNSYLTFKANSRTYLGFGLDHVQVPPAPTKEYTVYNGYEYSSDAVADGVPYVAFSHGLYVTHGELLSACPTGWSLVTFDQFNSKSARQSFYGAMPLDFRGYAMKDNTYATVGIALRQNNNYVQHIFSDGSTVQTNNLLYRPICRRSISN